MENIETNTKLTTILKEINELENNKLLLWATIYTRKCEELKKKKVSEFTEYLKGQVVFYKRNMHNYQEKINELVEEYDAKLTRLINQYNAYYIYLQNEIILANSNQKIAIANIATSKRALEKANNMKNEVLIEKANRKIFATAQKKLNYDVVIEEITSRLQRCMEDTYQNINSMFNIEFNSMAVNSANLGLINKIRAFFTITFSGDRNFKKYVLDDLENKFREIELSNVSKISDVKTEMLISVSQMDKIRKDINLAFNEVLNKA